MELSGGADGVYNELPNPERTIEIQSEAREPLLFDQIVLGDLVFSFWRIESQLAFPQHHFGLRDQLLTHPL